MHAVILRGGSQLLAVWTPGQDLDALGVPERRKRSMPRGRFPHLYGIVRKRGDVNAIRTPEGQVVAIHRSGPGADQGTRLGIMDADLVRPFAHGHAVAARTPSRPMASEGNAAHGAR